MRPKGSGRIFRARLKFCRDRALLMRCVSHLNRVHPIKKILWTYRDRSRLLTADDGDGVLKSGGGLLPLCFV
jgi:hypothetical protein